MILIYLVNDFYKLAMLIYVKLQFKFRKLLKFFIIKKKKKLRV